MKRRLIIAAVVLCFVAAAAGVPQPPHRVYGDIDDSDGPVDGINVEFRHNGNVEVSGTTNASGYYDLEIPYDSSYDGKELELYLEGSGTGNNVTFSSGSSERLDYSGTNIIQEPFDISGTITLNGSTEAGVVVSIYHSGSNLSSTTTSSDGTYSLTLSFSDSYDGENLTLYVDGSDTGKSTTFKTGGSATLDYSESTSTNNDETQNQDSGGTQDTSNNDSTDSDDSGSSDSGSDTGSDSSGSDQDSGQQADFNITSVEVTPKEASVGEEVTIKVTVKNNGDSTRNYTLSINAGGETLEKTVEDVPPGASKTVEFKESFDTADDYSIKAGSTTADLTVKKGGGLSLFQIMGLASLLMFLLVGLYKGAQMVDLGSGGEEEGGESRGAWESFRNSKTDDDGNFNWRYADDEE
ncbi:MAG: CARDB domain-containing protein [Candidatus Nanohaloarchaea archaeon]